MNHADLDRHVTGNYGEDSVPPDFFLARELAYLGMEVPIVINVAAETEEDIAVTVTKIAVTSDMVHITTKELAWTLVVPEEATVWLADKD